MESFATGLKRIHDVCTDVGVKAEFRKEPYGFTVRFHRHCGKCWNGVKRNDLSTEIKKGAEIGAEDMIDIRDRSPKALEKRIEMVLQIISIEPSISMNQIAEKLGISRRQVQKAVDKLKKNGKITRSGSDTSGKWIINE